jgi:hypothetical protein
MNKRCYGTTKVGLRCHNKVKQGYLCSGHFYQNQYQERRLVFERGRCYLGLAVNNLLVASTNLNPLPRNWTAVRKDLDYYDLG